MFSDDSTKLLLQLYSYIEYSLPIDQEYLLTVVDNNAYNLDLFHDNL